MYNTIRTQDISTFAEMIQYRDDIFELFEFLYKHRNNEGLIVSGIVELHNCGVEGYCYDFTINSTSIGAACFYNLEPDDGSWISVAPNRNKFHIFNPPNGDMKIEIGNFASSMQQTINMVEYELLSPKECTEEMFTQLEYLYTPDTVKLLMLSSLIFYKMDHMNIIYIENQYSPKVLLDFARSKLA